MQHASLVGSLAFTNPIWPRRFSDKASLFGWRHLRVRGGRKRTSLAGQEDEQQDLSTSREQRFGYHVKTPGTSSGR